MLFLIQEHSSNTGAVRTLGAREIEDVETIRDLTLDHRTMILREMIRIYAANVVRGMDLNLTMERSMDFDFEIDYASMQIHWSTSMDNYTLALVAIEDAEDGDDESDGSDEDSSESDEEKPKATTKAGGRCGSCGHNAYNHNHDSDDPWCEVCDDECAFVAEGGMAALR